MNSDKEIADCIIDMAQIRGVDKSLCPSEIARALRPNDWRILMPAVRSVAYQLAARQLIKISQKGQDVSEKIVKGPIRISIK